MIGNQVYFNRYGNTSIYNLKDRKETDLNSRIIFGPGYEKAIAQSGRAFQVCPVIDMRNQDFVFFIHFGPEKIHRLSSGMDANLQ